MPNRRPLRDSPRRGAGGGVEQDAAGEAGSSLQEESVEVLIARHGLPPLLSTPAAGSRTSNEMIVTSRAPAEFRPVAVGSLAIGPRSHLNNVLVS